MNAELLSSLAAPAVIAVFCILILQKREARYSSFIKGAKSGLKTTLNVFPVMTMLLVSLTMFSASGAAEGISSFLSPVCTKIGLPEGIIPLIVIRPFSGSGSVAAYSEVLEKFGPDSLESYAASVIMGSGDTLVYVISVYYSAVKSKKAGYVFPVSAFVSLFAVFTACTLARIFFAS